MSEEKSNTNEWHKVIRINRNSGPMEISISDEFVKLLNSIADCIGSYITRRGTKG